MRPKSTSSTLISTNGGVETSSSSRNGNGDVFHRGGVAVEPEIDYDDHPNTRNGNGVDITGSTLVNNSSSSASHMGTYHQQYMSALSKVSSSKTVKSSSNSSTARSRSLWARADSTSNGESSLDKRRERRADHHMRRAQTVSNDSHNYHHEESSHGQHSMTNGILTSYKRPTKVNNHNGSGMVDKFEGGSSDDSIVSVHYEDNLNKFKDERDAIQKKTFTKWLNKHLSKVRRNVRDLFEDLRDGQNLLSLLEVLSGETLPRERGRMRFHAIQNVETALRFLRYKEIKLVNIRGEDIVDGNPKLTLGLIWTIILHFQISDIVIGQDDAMSVREALLRWAQKTTHRYPNVRVTDFTQSWRDGLAFNAIIHRNRPDLLDWKKVERMRVRERIEHAFHIMEREYGVTRLLDPEDVDTPEPDEKSVITYLSQIYDVFPEPPSSHPLFDAESQKRISVYRQQASDLAHWIQEKTVEMKDRNFPHSLSELRRMSELSQRFRTHEVPPRLREKEQVVSNFRHDIEKILSSNSELHLDPHLTPDVLEKNWNEMMLAYQERDQILREQILKHEQLQRLAEKIMQECKVTDSKLDDIEVWIEREARRIESLHPQDAKANADQIENEMQRVEDVIKSLFNDVQILRDSRYNQANDCHKRVQQVHERWVNIRTLLQTKLINVLNIHTNPDFKFLAECTEWVHQKLKQLRESNYGSDVHSVKCEYERHQKEHKIIDQFQGNVEKCREAEVRFHGEELRIYGERMTILQKAFNELLVMSNKRVSDLHTLNDFMQSAHQQLMWLSEKEEKEVCRDYATDFKSVKILSLEKHFDSLVSEIERRENEFSSVVDRGESLVVSSHPASKLVEAHLSTLQSKWGWILQLTVCLQTHTRHIQNAQEFFSQCDVADEYLSLREQRLNGEFSVTDFKLDEGECLLKDMQVLRDEFSDYEREVVRLTQLAHEIVPLKARRERLKQPLEGITLAKYQNNEVSIEKDERCTVRDNSNLQKWKISRSSASSHSAVGGSIEIPGNAISLLPPDSEAIDRCDKLRRHYDRTILLWQKKHMRMRQNIIFATIKVVKSWDFQQFLSMGKEQRTTIRKALNEDSEKLIQEGERNDPQLARLRREIEEINRLFDEWERRASLEDEKRNATKRFQDKCCSLQSNLNDLERQIIKCCKGPIPRDLSNLKQLVLEHKRFEEELKRREPDINQVKNLFGNIVNPTSDDKSRLDKVLSQYDSIWSLSSHYVTRLGHVEVTLTSIEDVTSLIQEFERKLDVYNEMPDDIDSLRRAHDDLMNLEAEIESKQSLIDQLQCDVKEVRPSVEITRPSVNKHADVDRLEEDVNRLVKRWANCCMKIVERLRSCEAACELLEKYNMNYQTQTNWMDQLDSKLRNLEELEAARAKEAWEKHVKAVQERYQLAEKNIGKLSSWLDEIEKRIASQKAPSDNVDRLRDQISDIKSIREDVNSHNRQMNNLIDMISELLESGADVLTSSELSQLEQSGVKIKDRYEAVFNTCDTIWRRINNAFEELTKFDKEMSVFRQWLTSAYDTLESKERELSDLSNIESTSKSVKEFVADVMSHGADLKFLSISSQKYLDSCSDYVNCLEAFRSKLRISSHDGRGDSQSKISKQVEQTEVDYRKLLERANGLLDTVSRIGGKLNDFNNAVERATQWLSGVEPRVEKSCLESIGSDPKKIEEQLSEAKMLKNEILANGKLFEDVKQTATVLLRSADDTLSRREVEEIENIVDSLSNRYKSLLDKMSGCCSELEDSLVHSRGLQQGLNDFERWLDNSFTQLKDINGPASLIRERLDEQIRQMQIFNGEIDNRKSALVQLENASNDYLNDSQNSKESRSVAQKIRDAKNKFNELQRSGNSRFSFLQEVSSILDSFIFQAGELHDWCEKIVAMIQEDISDDELNNLSSEVEHKSPIFDKCISVGKDLIGRNDTTDKTLVKEEIKDLEEKFKNINIMLRRKLEDINSRNSRLIDYETMKQQIVAWLDKMEDIIKNFEPIALDVDLLKRQGSEVKSLLNEHTGFKDAMMKYYEMASKCDMLKVGSPSRKSSHHSITKPSLSISQDTNELRNRYDSIGESLRNREKDMKANDSLKVYLENLKELNVFLDKEERDFPKNELPSDVKKADAFSKVIRNILDRLFDNQSLMDETKIGVRDLIRRNMSAFGKEKLEKNLSDTLSRWKTLHDKCRTATDLADYIKDFIDLYENLNNWLNSKFRIMNVLGPVSSDPRIVRSQSSQINIIKDEFMEKKPQKIKLDDLGNSLIEYSPSDRKNIDEKLKSVDKRWNDLQKQLSDRERDLNALFGPSEEFLKLTNQLSDNLSRISDNIDDITHSTKTPSEKKTTLTGISSDLNDQRPILANIKALGDKLINSLSDNSSKAEIKNKVGHLERQFNNCQKKLDNLLAEVESEAREGKDFDDACKNQASLLTKLNRLLSDNLKLSADRVKLKKQYDSFEPIYHDIMSKEHEVIMIINRGQDILTRTNKNDRAQRQKAIDDLNKQWKDIKKCAQDKQKRLNTAMELCEKMYQQVEKFCPWLDKIEKDVFTLYPISFIRTDLQKQETEITAIRNDIHRHTSEFEGVMFSGKSFEEACDVDRNVVERELEIIRKRWEALNQIVSDRSNSIHDILSKLGNFNDDVRGFTNNLQRLEEKFDGANAGPRDQRALDEMTHILDDINSLNKSFGQLERNGNELISDANDLGSDASNIAKILDSLRDHVNDLKDRVTSGMKELKDAGAIVDGFRDIMRDISSGLSSLDDEISRMAPIGRDKVVLNAQLQEILKYISRLKNERAKLDQANTELKTIKRAGMTSHVEGLNDALSEVEKKWQKLDSRANKRHVDINGMIQKLSVFYDLYNSTVNKLKDFIKQEKSLTIVGNNKLLKEQQDKIKKLEYSIKQSLSSEVNKTNRDGQGLIQSASSGVDTTKLEDDLEQLNNMWNTLNENINEKLLKIENDLLNSGKFQDSLNALLAWINEMEKMLANQRLPSSDFKVLRAQIQEQKFVNKMVDDRKDAFDALVNIAKGLITSPDNKSNVQADIDDLMSRYSTLCRLCSDRMTLLEEAMKMAREFSDKLTPLERWLTKTEKLISDMRTVPTDEQSIQRRIDEHTKVHDEIVKKRYSFDEIVEVASALIQVVGDDDASYLTEKIDDLSNRYDALIAASENIRHLLRSSIEGLRILVISYEDLLQWIESTEDKLDRYRVMSVFPDKLSEQIRELGNICEEISGKQKKVDEVISLGDDMMKNICNDEAMKLKNKLDSLQRKYEELSSKACDYLKSAKDMLPLVADFHKSHSSLNEWMMGVEQLLPSLDSLSLEEQEFEISRIEKEIAEKQLLIDSINLHGPQICHLSPGEGAKAIEEIVTRDNKRFDSICDLVQRRSERIQISKRKSSDILEQLEDLLSWFRSVETRILEAESPSSEPDVIRMQLKEHKTLNDDISSQKGRVRDVLNSAKQVLRENARNSDSEHLKGMMDDLKETMDVVIQLSSDRLSLLEQALPLAIYFNDTHNELTQWFDEIEKDVMNQVMPSMRTDQISKQQEITRSLMQSVLDHKSVIDRLNKTGSSLLQLVAGDDGFKVQDILDTDNKRYNDLKISLKERQQALDDAMNECSQFIDRLDGMINSLSDTADQLHNAEPVSSIPDKIRDQIVENDALIEDIANKKNAYTAVKKAAEDIISKAANKNDPGVKDIKNKLGKLTTLWEDLQQGTKGRSKSLDEALQLATKFWAQLDDVMSTLDKIRNNLEAQSSPGVDPNLLETQKRELGVIKEEIDRVRPKVGECKQSGMNLMKVVGESEKPEIRRNLDDMENSLETITSLFARKERDLLEAIDKAMEYHDVFKSVLAFLEKAEITMSKMDSISSDINQVKKQIEELKHFKSEVDPWMVKMDSLNRQASFLCEHTSSAQTRVIMEPLSDLNRRWEDLNKSIANRQRELSQALLRLGQFQHALNELLVWIDRTDKTLDTLKPVYGDPPVIEVELAKLKVMVNDIQAHQSSVDTLNDAGHQIMEFEKESRQASDTHQKLNELNTNWNNLLSKAERCQLELEKALKEAHAFNQEIQDMLLWINDMDSAISSSKPVGGLPETAKDQLDRFMGIFNELEKTSPKVEGLLKRGHQYLDNSNEGAAVNLHNNLKTLKSKWENILVRANDKKVKLEIALKEAIEFNEAMQAFGDWLTKAEKHLSDLSPVSRVLDHIKVQIEEHKEFQNEVSSQRETMLSLDKKGTHLKYFSQKQDVILIKNLLVSIQHRWEKVVSKSAERTRALDYGYKEAKEFFEAWEFLCSWLDDVEVKYLEEISPQNKNDPSKIKKLLNKHKEFQKELAAKQPMYDSTMKNGKQLTDKAPKRDEPVLREMLTTLKEKWLRICNSAVEKQRKLEEALLFSGQFKDALKAIIEWLTQMEAMVDDRSPVHGDLDTVINLVEKHKNFELELNSRSEQIESLRRTAEELIENADKDDAAKVRNQLAEVTIKWDSVWVKSKNKTKRLEEALKQAEELHKSVNLLLEWLSDAEMRLRFSGPLPEDEDEIRRQLEDHDAFMCELKEKEKDKDFTINLAKDILDKCHPDAVNVIKHWITIIQSRWDEVASWALQRRDKLVEHLKGIESVLALMDELMRWLQERQDILTRLEGEDLPEDLQEVKKLIGEHQEFMDDLSSRQSEIDNVCKPVRPRSQAPSNRKTSSRYGKGRESIIDDNESEYSRKNSRMSPADSRYPKFDRKSSRGPSVGGRDQVRDSQAIKNPRARSLWDKWRHVWMMAWERDRRLRERLEYLDELERIKNFNWDEWRKRFLKFNQNKKSRVLELMRQIDTDSDGFHPRDEFIQGVLGCRFPSSRLEMNVVADKFDHGDGMIDWREFMAALRPDWEERAPENDNERIDDEINRQVALCTCRQKFRVFQVGEGKYRFGESQKLRLVRILRSTVMVRVGGGWMALDEFLVKNDPCRAKGRTNVELREQFTLAEGVSQSMTPFKSRTPSVANGPITKIKEKTDRSIPMQDGMPSYASNTFASSTSAGNSTYTPYEEQMQCFTPRQRNTYGTASRSGSRPPSRSGSNLSLNSDDSRNGNVNRSSSMRGGQSRSVVSRNTPTGFGSSSLARRITSTPIGQQSRLRGSTNEIVESSSHSAVDRTPMASRNMSNFANVSSSSSTNRYSTNSSSTHNISASSTSDFNSSTRRDGGGSGW